MEEDPNERKAEVEAATAKELAPWGLHAEQLLAGRRS